MSYWWQGHSDKGETALQNGLPYVDRLPQRWQVVYRAFIDCLQGNYDSAYESLQELIKTSSDIPDAYYILGEIATHSGRYLDALKAREFFEKALEIDPTFKIVFFHLFDAYVHGADLPAADRLLARYRQQDPSDPALADPEVVILTAKGQFDAAAARAEELVAQRHGIAFIRLFQAHLLAGNWERAHRAAENAIRRHPPGVLRAIAFGQRGLAQIAQGRLRAGLLDLREAVELLHDEIGFANFASSYLIHRALVLEAAGDIEAAVKDSQEAIRVDPLYHPAYFWLGRILLVAGRTEQAQEVFQELKVAAQKTLAPTGRFWVHLLQAELYLAAGRLTAAETELERAARLAPEHRDRATEWLVRARVEAASGELSEAITSYGRIFELGPSLSSLYSLHPWVVTTTRALYAMARLEEEAGDLASARQHYRQFLARWGEADLPIPDVQEAKSRLAKLEPQ